MVQSFPSKPPPRIWTCGRSKAKVEGKNTGKNVMVRALSGIGQAGAMLVGQGSLNQPLSESDLMRERVSNNVGEAGDEEVSRLAVTQHIVVTISADTPIYVVLEQTPKPNQGSLQPSARSVSTSNSANAEQLRQLLQLQKELNKTFHEQPTSAVDEWFSAMKIRRERVSAALPRRASRNVAHESIVTRPQSALSANAISNFRKRTSGQRR
jgi:hypothetical protein